MSVAATLLFTLPTGAPLPLDLVRFQLDWYRRLGEWEILLVEQGEEPRLATALPPGVAHRFVRNPGPFNQGWGFNLGARLARGAMLLPIEAGVLVPERALRRALKVCPAQAGAADLFQHLAELDRPQCEPLLSGQAGLPESAQGEYPGFCAGGFAVDRSLLLRLGGFDERLAAPGRSMEGMALKLDRSGAVLARFGNAAAGRLPIELPRAAPERTAMDAALLRETEHQGTVAFGFTCDVQRQLMGNEGKYRT